MTYSFRDQAPILGPGAQVEIPNGAGAPTLVSLQLIESVTLSNIAAAGAVNQVLWTTPANPSAATGALPLGKYSLVEVSVRFSTASTSGTLQIEKTPSGTAVGSGTNLLTSTVSLAGTTNTVVYGFPSATVASASTILSGGDSFSAIFAGTLTSLAGMNITLSFARIA